MVIEQRGMALFTRRGRASNFSSWMMFKGATADRQMYQAVSRQRKIGWLSMVDVRCRIQALIQNSKVKSFMDFRYMQVRGCTRVTSWSCATSLIIGHPNLVLSCRWRATKCSSRILTNTKSSLFLPNGHVLVVEAASMTTIFLLNSIVITIWLYPCASYH